MVVVVEDDELQRLMVVRRLEAEGYTVRSYEDGESCIEEMRGLMPDAVVLDVGLPGIDGFEVLSRWSEVHPDVPVTMLTAHEAVEVVVRAVRMGAFEYLVKPTTPHRLVTTVRNAVAQRRAVQRVHELESRIEGVSFPGFLGESAPMLRLYGQMHRVSATDVNVLVRGESGSGKELVARGLHATGPRSAGPFVAINCAAVPESLQESELFGHERGSFTGATARRIGRFEEADGGTLFLDEVGELSAGLQAKLLRVLQERAFHRVGGEAEIRSDFRLVVATHRDLVEEIREARFREDLYFRLAVFEIHVPPLRDRGDDVLLLANTFAATAGEEVRGEPSHLSAEAAAALRAHGWPGNVRELQNAIQRAVIVSSASQIEPWALPSHVQGSVAWPGRSGAMGGPPQADAPGARISDEVFEGMTLEDIERVAVEAAVRRHGGNRSRAAKELGIARTTLYRKLGGG
jgi:two-component system response regulator HydG